MAVDRCICHQIRFEEIKKMADEKDLHKVKDLQNAGICSTNCQLCVPYIKMMFETGETSFSPEDIFDHTNDV